MQGASLRAREKMAAARRCESPYHLLTSMLGWMSRKYALASQARACAGSGACWILGGILRWDPELAASRRLPCGGSAGPLLHVLAWGWGEHQSWSSPRCKQHNLLWHAMSIVEDKRRRLSTGAEWRG